MYSIFTFEEGRGDTIFYTLKDYDRAEECAKTLCRALGRAGGNFYVKVTNENGVILWRMTNTN